MNPKLLIYAVCAILALPVLGSEKKTRKKSAGSSLPPVSPMIALAADPSKAVQTVDSNGLISTKLGGRDLDFFESLLGAGQLPPTLGDLIKTKAESPRVKSVGVILASTQVEENKQINRLTAQNGVTISPLVESGRRAASAELEKLSGASFDIACVGKIVDANRQAVRAYEEGAQSDNPEIKTFSEQMLPNARERLRIAEKMIESTERPTGTNAGFAPRSSPMQLRPPAQPASGTPAVSKSSPYSTPRSGPPATNDEAPKPPAATKSESAQPGTDSAPSAPAGQ